MRAGAVFNLPAQPRFVPSVHLRVDTSDRALVKISAVTGCRDILAFRVEEPTTAVTIAVKVLDEDWLDRQILGELGEAKAETTFSMLWALLAKQGHGQRGVLLVDFGANVFYVRAKGELWSVSARWNDDAGGWDITGAVARSASAWSAGSQVFSLN